MIKNLNGEKVTPKQKAAEILEDYISRAEEFWVESENGYGLKYSERETQLINDQLKKYCDRILKIIGYERRS
jgi:hypothetical protein